MPTFLRLNVCGDGNSFILRGKESSAQISSFMIGHEIVFFFLLLARVDLICFPKMHPSEIVLC